MYILNDWKCHSEIIEIHRLKGVGMLSMVLGHFYDAVCPFGILTVPGHYTILLKNVNILSNI